MKNENKLNMQKRIYEVLKIVRIGATYLDEIIYPQILQVAVRENDITTLHNCTIGSYLIHHPVIQDYIVIRHYSIANTGDHYIIATNKNCAYGFYVDKNGLTRYGIFDKTTLKPFLHKKSKYVGKTIGEIADELQIPCVEAIPLVYKPVPHKIINSILEKSEEYLQNSIYPRFHGVLKESEEWFSFVDYAKGSILAHHPIVLNLQIVEHYYRDGIDYLVVERDGNTVYSFILDYNYNLIHYTSYDRNYLDQRMESQFIGKTLGDAIKDYDIPFVYEIPCLYE